jgi:signal transduction histidine kinase
MFDKLFPHSLKSLLLVHETALLILVIVTGALGGMWAYFWLQSSNESVRLNAMLYEAQQIRGDLYTQVKAVNRARLLEDNQALGYYQDYAERIDTHFHNLEQHVEQTNEQLVVEYMQKTYQTVRSDMDKIKSDPYLMNEDVHMKILDPLYEEWMLAEFESALVIFDEIIAKQRHQLEQSLAYWTRLAPWLIPLPVLLALVLLLWSRRSLQRGFVQPITELIEGARCISRGTLEYRIRPRGVAEIRQLTGAMNDMAQELSDSQDALVASERQAALGALVPVVAHNIRNPLASIRAAAQLLDAADDADELRETRSAIIDTVDRLERWVSSLLSYLHPLQPQLKPVRMLSIIEGALTPLSSKLQDKKLQLERLGWALDPMVCADIDLLEQALYGLLNNAADASPNGAVLTLELAVQAAGVDVMIIDRGPGLPFKPQPSTLSPGPTTKRFGTGLGIPFAFKVCQVHNGVLQFEQTDGGATRVRLTLPLADNHGQSA